MYTGSMKLSKSSIKIFASLPRQKVDSGNCVFNVISSFMGIGKSYA